MKKTIIWIVGILAVIGGALFFFKKKSTSQKSQYEGMLLKTIPYNYRSSYVYNGKRYEIRTGTAWSALNSTVGNLVGKTIELDINIVNQIPLGGYVNDSGQLMTE